MLRVPATDALHCLAEFEPRGGMLYEQHPFFAVLPRYYCTVSTIYQYKNRDKTGISVPEFGSNHGLKVGIDDSYGSPWSRTVKNSEQTNLARFQELNVVA